MNSLIPLLTVSVIAGFCELRGGGVHRRAGRDEVVDRALQRDEVQAGLAAVDGVEVAADDQRRPLRGARADVCACPITP